LRKSNIRNRVDMRNKGNLRRIKLTTCTAASFALALLLAGCARAPAGTNIPNLLDPRGPVASTIAQEWWIQFTLGTIVFVVVIGLTAYAVYTRREKHDRAGEVPLVEGPEDQGMPWILWGGVIVPVAVLVFLLGLSIYGHRSLAAPPSEPVIEIEVIGHRWWWEVRYPHEGIVDANQIHIPSGQPVRIHLTSNDVIHSFWVPQLTGKMDLNPGEINSIWIQADEPGIYRGLCAEFCGLQHANMQFLVVAEEPDDFDTWRTRVQQPPTPPVDAQAQYGQQVFMGSSCVYCHTIQGTNALATLGPDLTNLRNRLTLGAGIRDNNRGNLAGWILDPQHIKPGVQMPPTNLTGEELQALLAYLDTLH
jgi:cytochrome c oxidase subunit II